MANPISILRNPYIVGLVLLLVLAGAITWYVTKYGYPMALAPKPVWPVPGHTMGTGDGSDFGPRTPPVAGASAVHGGIDIPAGIGTMVVSPRAGKVTKAGWTTGGGNTLEIADKFGFTWVMMHLQAFLVDLHETVSAGEPVGLVGRTGNVSGPHLHLAVRKTGTTTNIDPEPLFA